MKDRVQEAVGQKAASEVVMGTFHSIANTFLRKYGLKVLLSGKILCAKVTHAKIGISNSFQIYDASQSLQVVREAMNELPASSLDFATVQNTISQVSLNSKTKICF